MVRAVHHVLDFLHVIAPISNKIPSKQLIRLRFLVLKKKES